MTTTSTYPKRVIAAALFDALKAAADRFGGIGSGLFYAEQANDPFITDPKTPQCAIGFLHYLGVLKRPLDSLIEAIPESKAILGFGWGGNDAGVAKVRRALGLVDEDETYLSSELPRVPFAAWAEYFNIHRAVELPAGAYDALKASSEKHGGIGAETFEAKKIASQSDSDEAVPYCIAGHAALIDSGETTPDTSVPMPTLRALQEAFGLGRWPEVFDVNDAAVHAINSRKGLHKTTRVTFDEWTAELNVVRGAE